MPPPIAEHVLGAVLYGAEESDRLFPISLSGQPPEIANFIRSEYRTARRSGHTARFARQLAELSPYLQPY